MDGDYRADFLRTLAEGREVSLRQLSGRISMRFIGGLVNKSSIDLFSRPDIFLAAKKNGSYFGRTETAHNNTRPSWRDYFIFDYKHKDSIEIFGLDEDWFSSEFVDYIKLTELPTSGYLDMRQGNITLAIKVEPSKRPEGQYTGEAAQSIFDEPYFLDDFSPISDKVLKTYEEDARAQIMSTVASIAIPEAFIFTLMKRARFIEKITATWFGHSITHEYINQSEADKQEVSL